MLRKHPWINLDTTQSHIGDIESYVKSCSTSIRNRFLLDSSEEVEIATKVMSLSNGMFLYAKIVLDNLFSQDSTSLIGDFLRTTFIKNSTRHTSVWLFVFSTDPLPREEVRNEYTGLDNHSTCRQTTALAGSPVEILHRPGKGNMQLPREKSGLV